MPTGLLRGSAVPGPGHVPWTVTAWAGPGRGNAPAPEHVAETMALLPTETAPELALALVGGGTTDDLKLGTEADGRFSLVVFYRGLHCPICRKQLGEIDKRIEDLTATGIGRAVAIPMETEEPSGRIVHQWHLANLPVAYGLSEEAARAWGWGSESLAHDQGRRAGPLQRTGHLHPGRGPDVVLVQHRDHALRPALDDVVAGVRYAQEHDYPTRGAS